MLLSRLSGVRSFHFNLLSPFLLIVPILSSQGFLLNPSLLTPTISLVNSFSIYFNFHYLIYLGIDVSTHNIIIPPQMALNHNIIDLHNNIHPITKNISQHPINQSHSTHHPDHTMLHSTQPHLIRNIKLPCFTTNLLIVKEIYTTNSKYEI